MRAIVISEFEQWQHFDLLRLVVNTYFTDHADESTVHSFRKPIGLGMVSGSQSNACPHFFY